MATHELGAVGVEVGIGLDEAVLTKRRDGAVRSDRRDASEAPSDRRYEKGSPRSVFPRPLLAFSARTLAASRDVNNISRRGVRDKSADVGMTRQRMWE